MLYPSTRKRRVTILIYQFSNFQKEMGLYFDHGLEYIIFFSKRSQTLVKIQTTE